MKLPSDGEPCAPNNITEILKAERCILMSRSNHLCVLYGFESRTSHLRQANFYLRLCQMFFPGLLPFSPHLLIGQFHMSLNNLERVVKLNKMKKKVNKQCLINTPRRITVYHKKYFGNIISSCKCQMGVHHVGMISNCSIKNCGRS